MPKGKNIDAFKSELREFRILAKRADERLRQIKEWKRKHGAKI